MKDGDQKRYLEGPRDTAEGQCEQTRMGLPSRTNEPALELVQTVA